MQATYAIYFAFGDKVSHWNSPCELEIWPVSSWDSPLQQENSSAAAGGQNSGLHACAVRILPTEPGNELSAQMH